MPARRGRASPGGLALLALLASASLQFQEARSAASKNEPSDQHAASLHFLLLDSRNQTAAANDTNTRRLLDDVLGRVGPDMRPASGFEDFYADVSMEVAQLAWRSMHKHAELVAKRRVELLWPVAEEALRQANVSARCLEAAASTARAAQQLKTWAIQLLNAWGSFPAAGVFEGTMGDVGSFHGCLNVPQNEPTGHAHYCSLSYRPVLAPRRDYQLVIEREPRELLDLFGPDDALGKLAASAQYNHFVYHKFGACFPIGCSPPDVQRLARLLGRRASLQSGPVKCHSRFASDYEQEEELEQGRAKLAISFKDLNRGLYVWKPHVTSGQRVAIGLLGLLLGLISALTLADLLLNRAPALLRTFNGPARDLNSEQQAKRATSERANELQQPIKTDDPNNNELTLLPPDSRKLTTINGTSTPAAAAAAAAELEVREGAPKSLVRELIHDCSLVTSAADFLHVSERQLASEILCLNGLRCITMSWIILAHTIQYNDWSAFARIYDVETQLLSWLNQPIFNASYLVDTFFLMSGLLTSYTVFKRKRAPAGPGDSQRALEELWRNFSLKSYLIGRYLRLTPQILLVSLLFILLPLANSTAGPHWTAMTAEYAENCSNNWWLNLLHVQAFYKPHEMCNFVCWWISVDMLYHLGALALIVLVLRAARPRLVLQACALLAAANLANQAWRHHRARLPPNLLATIPQVGAMWSEMTLNYFWTPTAHLFPFTFGFYLGFLLAHRRARLAAWFTRQRALAGWLAALAGFAAVLLGTRWWVVGEAKYSASASTAFNVASQLVWSSCLGWTIFACHFGHAAAIGRLLACRLFIVLGRASYLVYLSHFLVLFAFFGSQNLLLEPTRAMIVYIILGNVVLSMLLGSLLHVCFELPWLRLQKRIMRHV